MVKRSQRSVNWPSTFFTGRPRRVRYRTHEHRIPHVGDFVKSGPEHRFFRSIASDNRDHGVLHSASHKAFHDRHVGIGIRGEAVAQKLNRELPELCGSPPAAGLRGARVGPGPLVNGGVKAGRGRDGVGR